MKLLTRCEFRETVFTRDQYKCVVCGKEALDAHHIMERRLWSDGGYYLDNGVSLCEQCHIRAEMTVITCEQLRHLAGIKKVILPPHLYDDNIYDKWGNIILSDSVRVKGELFHDESVQKILKQGNVLSNFREWVKYPRTYHLPWSDNITDDDEVLSNTKMFEDRRVVVTEKMDGENTSIYKNYIHARSIDGRDHFTRSWVKNMAAKIQHDIPDGWRICGENLYAEHSIHYKDLPSYFMVFSIWDNENNCLSWEETESYCDLLDLYHVPVLYKGIWDEEIIKNLYSDKEHRTKEGYVVRKACEFPYLNFRNCVAKYVRKNHVMTQKHWMFGGTIKLNELQTIS
jgi:hypothetical protein